MKDRELFSLLCSVVYEADRMHSTDRQVIASIIESHLRGYRGPNEQSKEKLERAVLCMVLGYLASEMKKQADAEYEQLFLQKGETK